MSLVEFFSQPVWHRLSLTLVHFLWQGLAVAVLACAAVRVLRLPRGNPRYAAYLLAFTVMTVSPLLTFVVLGGYPASTASAPRPAPQIASPGTIPHATASEPPQQRGEIVPNDDHAPMSAPTQLVPLRVKLATLAQAALPWAVVGWMGGVLILSVRLLLGFLGVHRWRRDVEPLAEGLAARVALLSERLDLPGFARVFTSRRAREVVALGYWRPLVLLPVTLATQIPPEMLEAVIAHELAHIRRLDLWVNLAQRIVETLLFYHPAVWWLSNRLRIERELCCDEMAVRATGQRLVYASALENAGRARLSAGQPALALGFGQSRRSTLGRVRHILGLPPAPANSPYWLAGIVTFMVLAILVMRAPSSLTAQAATQARAKVAGRVLAKETGQPIAGARVRVAVPATDMRLARGASTQVTQDNGVKSDIYETKTDAAGRFEIPVMAGPGRDTASVNVLTPGYGSAAGAGATDNPQLARLSLTGPSADATSSLTISLPRALYVAGVAKDDREKPLGGVRIEALNYSGVGDRLIVGAETDEQGRFEVFDLPAQLDPDYERATLLFRPPAPLMSGVWSLADLYRMAPEKRASLEITVRRVVKIAGVLLDVEGRPVSGVTVEAHHGQSVSVASHATTEADGRFELTDLWSAASYELRAGALDLQQKAVQPVTITDHDENVTLRMKWVQLENPLQPVALFGMQLADFTPELREAFDLGRGGVLVLDPGPDYRRLGLKTVRKCSCILRIERVPVFSLRNMVAEILQHQAQTKDQNEGILVRYADRFSTDTESLKLTPADVAELKQLAQKLGLADTSPAAPVSKADSSNGASPGGARVRIAGRVLASQTQQPIANALVRVAVPATEMRSARIPRKQIIQDNGTKSDLYETRTDPNGRFEVLVPVENGKDTASVDAMAPGHGSAAGTFHSGGGHPRLARLSLTGPSGDEFSHLTITLPRALYVAGVVRDSTGAPVAGATVLGQMIRAGASFGIGRTQTDQEGRFEMFDFPLQKQPGEKEQLIFTSRTTMETRIEDFYSLSPEKVASLEVTLPRGAKITGTVLDAEGQPAAGVLMEAVSGFPFKETVTNRNGQFELAGLPPGSISVHAHALRIDQKAVQSFTLTERDQSTTLRLQRIELKNPLRPVTLWGMRLVDLTPELKDVYDVLTTETGVLILEVSLDSLRLDIGMIQKGFCFCTVGERRIANIREMVTELLRLIGDSETPPAPRVVYTIRNGLNSQYLKLTPADIAELRQLAEKLGITAPGGN